MGGNGVSLTELPKDSEMSQQTEPEAIHVPAQYLQNIGSLQEYLQKVSCPRYPYVSQHNKIQEIIRSLCCCPFLSFRALTWQTADTW